MQSSNVDKCSGANRSNIAHKLYRILEGKWQQTRLKLKTEVF